MKPKKNHKQDKKLKWVNPVFEVRRIKWKGFSVSAAASYTPSNPVGNPAVPSAIPMKTPSSIPRNIPRSMPTTGNPSIPHTNY